MPLNENLQIIRLKILYYKDKGDNSRIKRSIKKEKFFEVKRI